MKYDHVVLAAGKSSRMGFPKGLLETPEGKNFIHARARRTHNCGARRTVLVLGYHSDEILDNISPLPDHVQVVKNETPDEGQTSSFKCALESTSYCPPVLMELVDQPPLSENIYKQYLAGADREKINIPVYEGRRGHPPLFPGWFLEEVEELPVTRGINSLYEKYSSEIKEIPVDDSRVLMDLDTPGDYENYINKLG
ncbi:MAG: nucleotidyltransferase family protein [bacterium]